MWLKILASLCFVTSVAARDLLITEFMAKNDSAFTNQTGNFYDWIEIHNPEISNVDLKGWFLTDKTNDLQKWEFPATNINAGAYMLVFASGNDQKIPGEELHSNFKLSSSGEFLALIKPDGTTISHSYSPDFPPQIADISYGIYGTISNEILNPATIDHASHVVSLGNASDTRFVKRRRVNTRFWRDAVLSVLTTEKPDIPKSTFETDIRSPGTATLQAISINSNFQEMYFTSPTPGYANFPGASDLGPVIKFPGHYPSAPKITDNIIVTAQITKTFHDIANAELNYRVMFSSENTLPMYQANGNIYTSTIPTGVAAPGEMVRYFVTAEDISNNISRYPQFATTNTDEYLGAVINDPSIQTNVNIYHWFVEDTNAADTRTGTRCSLYFNNRFYDNIFCRLRGNTSAHYKLKKVPHKIEFNSGNYFKFAENESKVDEINIIAMYNDGSYMRDYLSWQVFKNSGSPYCYNYYINLRQNAEFHSLAMFVEQIDGDYLRRNNLPDDCSLYKISEQNIAWLYNTNGFEKVRPKDNDFSDFQSFISGLTSGSKNDKSVFLYDNLDVPGVVNFLSVGKVLQAYDLRHNNFRVYHDFHEKDEWSILPWDLDLTFGHVWNGSNTFGNNDYWRDETWYGRGASSPYWDWSNALYGLVYELPGFSNMFARRLRTLMDEFLQPTNTPVSQLKFENKIFEIKNIIKPLADADRLKWAWPDKWYNWPTQWINEAVIDITNNYLAERRVHLYVTHGIDNGGIIPYAQPENTSILFTNVAVYPVSGNQKEEFIEMINTNIFATDISGWRLSNAVTFAFAGGTVIPSESSIFVSPDVISFRGRGESPKGGERNFVVGNYNNFAVKGKMLYLTDKSGNEVDSIYVTPEPAILWMIALCALLRWLDY